MSSFGAISTAMTALQAHRRAMDVTGNNIANVNTPGYTRQRVDLQPRVAPGAASQFYNQRLAGAGVEVLGTTRMADEFLTARVRSQTSSFADLQAQANSLAEVERTLGEPSDTGLSQNLSEMWNAWSNLGAQAGSTGELAAQNVVANKSQAVVDSLRSGQANVAQSWTDQRAQADALSTEVNGLSSRIAKLNEAVLNTSTDGAANELVDQRDQLVTRFVELTGATAVPTSNNQVNVYLGGNPAVAGIQSNAVVVTGATQLDATAGQPGSGVRATPVKISWADPANPSNPKAGAPEITLTGGQLKGTFTSLNSTLVDASTRYDEIAASLVATVNGSVDASGKGTGYAATGAATGFLGGTTVAELTVLVAAKDIRAGTAGNGAADGSAANGIGNLRNAKGGPDALWKAHVVEVGVNVQAAKSRANTVQATLSTAIADQQSATGVSLDEETANLLVQQRAYEGAARVLTAVDQALDTLINRTGLVGR